MEHVLDAISAVTDSELVCRLERLVKADRALSVKLLVHLGEMHARKLYVGRGYSTMFAYCMSVLGMSEAEAGLRLKVAKVCRRYPLVLEQLGAGAVHLTAIKMLAPVLTAENHSQLLERARGKSKSQIELIVAEILPKPDVAPRLRKLPESRAPRQALLLAPQASAATPLPSSALVQPSSEVRAPHVAPAAADPSFVLQSPRARASTSVLRPGRFKLEVTLGQEAHSKLEQLRELLRHQNPNGDLAVIVERALGELLERTMKKRFGQMNARKPRVVRSRTAAAAKSTPLAEEKMRAQSPRNSRYVPRDVLRTVYARDAGQCTFVSSDGRRCTERGFLEMDHHEITFARGGAPTADNLRLACRAHNFFWAEQDYGREYMQRKVGEAAGSGTRSRLISSQAASDLELYSTR